MRNEALLKACEADMEELVQILLSDREGCADFSRYVNMKNGLGDSPLQVACSKGFLSIVKILVEEGKADLGVVQGLTRKTPLITAANKGHVHVVEYLVTTGGDDVNRLGSLNTTPLHFCASSKFDSAAQPETVRMEMIRIILEEGGADVNLPCGQGNSPIITACYANSLPTVMYLFEKGGRVNQHNAENGRSALMVAASEGHLDIVKWLVEEGMAKLDLKNHNGFTPVCAAAFYNHLPVVKYLVQKECDVNVANKW